MIYRYEIVDSTNRLAVTGASGDVFVAAAQTNGRGRLDHKWHSRPGENLLMSAVYGVAGIAPAEVSAFPLVAGLAVAEAVGGLLAAVRGSSKVSIKWPNDVYVGSRKISGILCERHGENVIVGIGVNVRQREFPAELAEKATSLSVSGAEVSVDEAFERVIESLDAGYRKWLRGGFAAFHGELEGRDFLKGRQVSVMLTDDDPSPVHGLCNGIASDGSLLVGTERIYAGEVRW